MDGVTSHARHHNCHGHNDGNDLPDLVHDEMLHTVATIGTYDEIADMLNDRFAERLDRIEFSIPVNGAADADAYRQILRQLR